MRILFSVLLCIFSVSAYAEYSMKELQNDIKTGNTAMAYTYLGGALEFAQTTYMTLNVTKQPKPYCLPRNRSLTIDDALAIAQRSFRDQLISDKLGKHSAAGHFGMGLMVYYSCDENGRPKDLSKP